MIHRLVRLLLELSTMKHIFILQNPGGGGISDEPGGSAMFPTHQQPGRTPSQS